MARKPKDRYLVTASYSLGWGVQKQDTLSSGYGAASEHDAMEIAATIVADMRREGADSPVRRVAVRQWPGDTPLNDAPVLYEASCYDSEQHLTGVETYAARVHDWHHPTDRSNIKHIMNRSVYGVGYSEWNLSWGPEPNQCPYCGDSIPLPLEPFMEKAGPLIPNYYLDWKR